MSRTMPRYALRGALKAAAWAALLAALAVVLVGCAAPLELADGCATDTECEQQCLADLRPDEDPAVCAVSLEPSK